MGRQYFRLLCLWTLSFQLYILELLFYHQSYFFVSSQTFSYFFGALYKFSIRIRCIQLNPLIFISIPDRQLSHLVTLLFPQLNKRLNIPTTSYLTMDRRCLWLHFRFIIQSHRSRILSIQISNSFISLILMH